MFNINHYQVVICDYYELSKIGIGFSDDISKATLLESNMNIPIGEFNRINYFWNFSGKKYLINEAKTIEVNEINKAKMAERMKIKSKGKSGETSNVIDAIKDLATAIASKGGEQDYAEKKLAGRPKKSE